jgi:phosphoribosyl 1,2-cyclic phosphodiesterase
VSIGYLADTGSWSERMAESLVDVDVLGVEFNHDVALQKSAPRPAFLIARNLSDRGHLSNLQGAELIQAILARSGTGALRHVVLLHLSEQCNQPELAIQAADDAIRAAGRRSIVHAARQSPAFPNLWVTPRFTRPRDPAQAAAPRPVPAPIRKVSSSNGRSRCYTGFMFADPD